MSQGEICGENIAIDTYTYIHIYIHTHIYMCSASKSNPSAPSPPFHGSCQHNTPLFLHKGFSHTTVAPWNKGSPWHVRDEGRIPKWLHQLTGTPCKKNLPKKHQQLLGWPSKLFAFSVTELWESPARIMPYGALQNKKKKKKKETKPN